jgi:hypothetical protein
MTTPIRRHIDPRSHERHNDCWTLDRDPSAQTVRTWQTSCAAANPTMRPRQTTWTPSSTGSRGRCQPEDCRRGPLDERAHRGRVDKAGRPYIDHPRTVARILVDQGLGGYAVMAGLLHDVVEDADVTAGHSG